MLNTGEALTWLGVALIIRTQGYALSIWQRVKVIPGVGIQIVGRDALQIVHRVRGASAQHIDVLAIVDNLVPIATLGIVSHLWPANVNILPDLGSQIQAVHVARVIESSRAANCIQIMLVYNDSRSILCGRQVSTHFQALHSGAGVARAIHIAVVGARLSKWIPCAAV